MMYPPSYLFLILVGARKILSADVFEPTEQLPSGSTCLLGIMLLRLGRLLGSTHSQAVVAVFSIDRAGDLLINF
jgi:hypothetical protein